MLQAFDWIRRSRSGAELLSILSMLAEDPDCFDRFGAVWDNASIGPVHYAFATPCSRCWLFPRLPASVFCSACRVIRNGTRDIGNLPRESLVIWAYCHRLPTQLRGVNAMKDRLILGAYVHDEQHFLMMLERRELRNWLQELVLYDGADLRGHIQVFPTRGMSNGIGMGDIICQAVRHESYFTLDRLRVRFYTQNHQVLRPHDFDKDGLLTFDASELLSLLEMARIFRTIFHPSEQKILYELLTIEDRSEASFFWGRMSGALNQRGRDLLTAWDIRAWPVRRIKFFYELIENVDF
ncbi:hypothetical protein KFU94_18080 [Chloroflexi bacterium TSY]|nr:hypothetical protein [Chloroflexi bacterium TSY]